MKQFYLLFGWHEKLSSNDWSTEFCSFFLSPEKSETWWTSQVCFALKKREGKDALTDQWDWPFIVQIGQTKTTDLKITTRKFCNWTQVLWIIKTLHLTWNAKLEKYNNNKIKHVSSQSIRLEINSYVREIFLWYDFSFTSKKNCRKQVTVS